MSEISPVIADSSDSAKKSPKSSALSNSPIALPMSEISPVIADSSDSAKKSPKSSELAYSSIALPMSEISLVIAGSSDSAKKSPKSSVLAYSSPKSLAIASEIFASEDLAKKSARSPASLITLLVSLSSVKSARFESASSTDEV